MKFLQMNRIAHLRGFIVMLGFALIPVSSGHSRDSMIAFSSDRDSPGDQDIFVMMVDGTQPRNLTNNPTASGFISPTGHRMGRKNCIFSHDRDGNLEIYVMDADGKNPVRLTKEPAETVRRAGLQMGGKLPLSRSVMGT